MADFKIWLGPLSLRVQGGRSVVKKRAPRKNSLFLSEKGRLEGTSENFQYNRTPCNF